MKLSYALLGLAVASVTPTAAAYQTDVAAITGESVPFAVEIDASHQPASLTEVAYPQAAGVRQINGDCDVRFDVAETGATQDVQVTRCSSELFRAEAQRIAEGMRYDKAAANVSAHISWTIAPAEAVVATASLQ